MFYDVEILVLKGMLVWILWYVGNCGCVWEVVLILLKFCVVIDICRIEYWLLEWS